MSLANPATRDPSSRPGTARAAIVAAINGVAGLTGYPAAPDQATAGAGWPRWIQTTYDGHLDALARDSYDVLVTLPGDYAPTTVDEGDKLRDVVVMALLTVGRVRYAEPVSIAFADHQTMPGLRFRFTVE